MTRPFRVTDLLDVLIRLEERGHAFYADLAARTKSDRARALFAQLGDEELQHEALYRDLRKTLEDAPEPERTPEETRRLDTLIRQSFAFEEFRPILKDSEEAWEQAVDFAIRLEKNTVAYIREIRSIFRNMAPEVFAQALAEEEGHVKRLLNYRDETLR